MATVCGHVISSWCSQPDGTSISLATSARTPSFRFRIPLAVREKFGHHFEDQFLDRLVCGLGRIQDSRDGHEIVITQSNAIVTLPDRPGLPPFDSDAHRPCDPQVVLPKPTREAKPEYTARAIRDNAEGEVLVQAEVGEDGRVRRTRVIRSLHEDLDAQAIKAAREWRFVPGTFEGKPAPVVVTIGLTFMLRSGRRR